MAIETVPCKGCGKPIQWLKTKDGKWMPVEPLENLSGETIFDHKKMISHFSTCEKAEFFRKSKYQKRGR